MSFGRTPGIFRLEVIGRLLRMVEAQPELSQIHLAVDDSLKSQQSCVESLPEFR
jgi:hypothetical protein